MNAEHTIVKMLADRWFAGLKNFDTALDALSDEQLQRETAPGKNRGIYLLGHLVAVHDDMLRLLDFGAPLFPELRKPFLDSPDKAVADLPSAHELRTSWRKVNDIIAGKINSMQPNEWFARHTAVSEEDFAKEPHRNKLNILLTRTTHLAYHTGQMVLLR